MDIREVQTRLNNHGFPCGAVDGNLGPRTKAAVLHFQRACNSVPYLTLDGIPGPKTIAGLERLPHLSLHFVVEELASHGNGNCYVMRELLTALESFRTAYGGPIHIISAYRDPAHNKSVGGAQYSMHVLGYAADIPQIMSWQRVANMRLFSGIGQRHGMISHVDMRHLSDKNTTGGSPNNPVVWTY